MKRLLFSLVLAQAAAVGCTEARADSVAYSNPGTVAPQPTLYGQSNGEVYGYFVQGGNASGGSAGDTDYAYLYDATTGTLSCATFNSQTTAAGTMADFGYVNQGDLLIFAVYDSATGSIGASDGRYSSDGLNHVYTAGFTGGVLNGASLPAGLYVGMEDRMQGQQWADFNYRDETFVATNVTATPEPESLALLATGLLGGVGVLRRRMRG